MAPAMAIPDTAMVVLFFIVLLQIWMTLRERSIWGH
jgi:hypothetical protein